MSERTSVYYGISAVKKGWVVPMHCDWILS
jgi:hypothetical protein